MLSISVSIFAFMFIYVWVIFSNTPPLPLFPSTSSRPPSATRISQRRLLYT